MGAVKEGEDAVEVLLGLRLPIDARLLIGDRREHVEALVALRRHALVGAGGGVEVEREVVRQDPLVEDVVQQPFVAGAEDDGVMGDVFVGLLGAEVGDEEAHGLAPPGDCVVGVFLAVLCGDHLGVDDGGICVADDEVGLEGLTALEPDAADGSAGVDLNLGHRGVEANLDAELGEQAGERADDGGGSAERVVDAPLPLQPVDEHVDGAGLEGVSADQQGLEGEDLPEPLILHEAGDEAVDRLVGAEPDHVGDDTEHLADTVEGAVCELQVADVEDLLRLGDEPLVVVDIAGVDGADVGEQTLFVSDVVEAGAVVELDAVEGIYRDELEVVFTLAPDEFEEFVEQVGGGDDGGAGVEGEAVALEDRGATARLFVGLEDGDVPAAGAETDGRSEPSEAGTNDDGAIA